MKKTLASLEDLVGEPAAEGDLFNIEAAYMQAVVAIADDDRQGHFHPSANSDCGRKNVYEYNRAPAMSMAEIYAYDNTRRGEKGSLNTTEKAVRTEAGGRADKRVPDHVRERDSLDFGHALHELLGRRMAQIRTHFESQGYVVEIELEKKHDPATDFLRLTYGIGGTADGILTVTNRKMIRQRLTLEFKSSKTDLFQDLKKPKEAHVNQAHIYSFRFDTPGMVIWYFSKDDADRKIYPVVFSFGVFEAVLDRYVGWYDHVQKGTLPEREENFYMCPRCAYQHICKPELLRRADPAKAHAIARARGGFRTGPAAAKGKLPGAQLVHLRKKP